MSRRIQRLEQQSIAVWSSDETRNICTSHIDGGQWRSWYPEQLAVFSKLSILWMGGLIARSPPIDCCRLTMLSQSCCRRTPNDRKLETLLALRATMISARRLNCSVRSCSIAPLPMLLGKRMICVAQQAPPRHFTASCLDCSLHASVAIPRGDNYSLCIGNQAGRHRHLPLVMMFSLS